MVMVSVGGCAGESGVWGVGRETRLTVVRSGEAGVGVRRGWGGDGGGS